MTITNGYCTLAQLKERLWPSGSTPDTVEDSMLEGLINTASRKIDGDTERRFFTTAADETRTYRAEWWDCLYPDDILSITSLKTDDDGDGVFETTWVAADYQLLPSNAALEGKPYNKIEISPARDHSFPTGDWQGVQIVGKFGYAGLTVSEARVFTAVNANFVYVDDLLTLPVGGLKTDDNDDGTYETTWVLTTDFALVPVSGTPTTWLIKAGSKSFPTTSDGVQITATWGANDAPDTIREACIVKSQILYIQKNAYGFMGTRDTTIQDLSAIYNQLIAEYVRLV